MKDQAKTSQSEDAVRHPLDGSGITYVDGNTLVLASGVRVGPFSSHWAACAAMIRLSNPSFESLGGDKQCDLDIEADALLAARKS